MTLPVPYERPFPTLLFRTFFFLLPPLSICHQRMLGLADNLGAAEQTLLNGFFTMSRRDRAWLVLTVILSGAAYLLWPILFSLKVDGNTSMSWAAVWTPLWIADGIGEDTVVAAAEHVMHVVLRHSLSLWAVSVAKVNLARKK